MRRLAELGILVAPGEFYGPAGERHVRVAVTATDERIAAAVGGWWPEAAARYCRTGGASSGLIIRRGIGPSGP